MHIVALAVCLLVVLRVLRTDAAGAPEGAQIPRAEAPVRAPSLAGA